MTEVSDIDKGHPAVPGPADLNEVPAEGDERPEVGGGPAPDDGEAELAITDVPFVALLPELLRPLVVELLEPRDFAFGEEIIEQGGTPDALYIMARGSARVIITGEQGTEASLARLGPGDLFGEEGLLDGSPRTATIRASSPVRVLVMERRIYAALERVHPEVREALGQHRRTRMLHRFLRTQSAFSSLPTQGLVEMAGALRDMVVGPGQIVIHQGDPADCVYIVRDGRLRVFRSTGPEQVDVGFLRTGDVFGEAALDPGRVRQASVEALVETSLLRLDAEAFRDLATCYGDVRTRLDEIIEARLRRSSGSVPLDFAGDILPADAASTARARPSQTPGRDAGEDDPGLLAAPELGGGDAEPAAAPARARRFAVMRQLDAMDCGAACLGMIARSYGHKVSMPFIRQEAGTSVSGTTLSGLQRGGEAIGLRVDPVRVSADRLDRTPLPAIMHWEGNHWVVLVDVHGSTVKVADPAIGLRRMDRDEFEKGWTGYAALVTATPQLAAAPRSHSGLQWLVPFIRPHRRMLLLALILAMASAAAEVAVPLFSQYIVDDGILKHDTSVVTALGLGAIALGVLSAVIMYGQRRALTRVAVGLDTSSLAQLTETLFGLPLSYFESRRTGDMERRLASLQQVNQTITRQGVTAITAVTQLVMIVALMFFYSPLLVGVFLATLAIFSLSIRYAIRKVGPVYASLEHAFGKFSARQVDFLKGIETVKVSGDRSNILHSMGAALTDLGSKRHDADRVGGRFSAGITVIGMSTVALFTYLGALWVLHGRFTLGQYLAFVMLAGLAVAPSQQIALMWDDVQKSSVLLQRLQDVFEQQPEQADRIGRLQPVPALAGEVRLKRLGFSYRSRRGQEPDATMVLSDIDLEVLPGMTVGLVGRSGSGKSTLLRLLAGLLEPTRGVILYDATDITTLDYQQLRRRMGVVLQQPYLFSATIAENIAFGDDQPSPERVQRAAEIADAHNFVERLPLRYATPIGDSGLRLSGGQAQRIAIARAVYWEPAVMLLDEATSSLDSEAERTVKENLEQVLKGRTAFVVAHRLSTVRDADLIVVLDQGRIIERGDHEQLMAKEGLYAYLYSQQVSDV